MSPVILLIDLERTGNLVEAGFWVVFGLAILVAARRRPRPLRVLVLAACLIAILFGVSDLVEAHTGAWWRPWWLLAWKAACLGGFAACVLKYRRLRVERPGQTAAEQVPSSSM